MQQQQQQLPPMQPLPPISLAYHHQHQYSLPPPPPPPAQRYSPQGYAGAEKTEEKDLERARGSSRPGSRSSVGEKEDGREREREGKGE